MDETITRMIFLAEVMCAFEIVVRTTGL